MHVAAACKAEELGRHDIQLLADVLANANHRPSAVRRRAVRVLGFVMVFDAAQVLGQRLALGLAARLAGRRVLRGKLGLQRIELCLQAGLVLGQRLFKQPALLGAHRLGLGAELPGLEPCQFKGDLLQLGALELELALLVLDTLIALLQLQILNRELGQHLSRQYLRSLWAQTLKVTGFECARIKHAPIMQERPRPRNSDKLCQPEQRRFNAKRLAVTPA